MPGDKRHCAGCRDDHPVHRDPKTSRCRSLGGASVVKRWRLDWWTPPTRPGALVQVRTNDCHRAPGRYALLTGGCPGRAAAMRGDVAPGEVYQGDGSSGAILSQSETYRFALWRSWNPGLPVAVFVMLNPSTADAIANDPTIRKCIGFAKRWDCGAIYVVNLFAYRATKPKDLPRSDLAREGPGNTAHHIRALSRMCSPGVVPGPCVVAWGSQPQRVLGTAPAVFKSIAMAERVDLKCLGTTQNGSPRHPLMLAYSTPLEPWGAS